MIWEVSSASAVDLKIAAYEPNSLSFFRELRKVELKKKAFGSKTQENIPGRRTVHRLFYKGQRAKVENKEQGRFITFFIKSVQITRNNVFPITFTRQKDSLFSKKKSSNSRLVGGLVSWKLA